jgi:hypothetical protein
MTTKYNLNPVLKRIIQDFEDAIERKAISSYINSSKSLQDNDKEIEEEYQEAKTNLIDLIGEMDQEIYGKGGGLASPAAKRNRARKKQNPRHEVQSRVGKNRSVAPAKLKQKEKARVGKHK